MSADILGTNCDLCVSMAQCCFTSTETKAHWDEKSRTATSAFTQLLNSEPRRASYSSFKRLSESKGQNWEIDKGAEPATRQAN